MTKLIISGNDSNGAEVSNSPKSRKSAQSSKKGKNLFYIVLKRARDRYNLQHDKSSCSLYGDCILDEIRETNGISEAMFKARFSEIVMDLMDRKSFHLKCDGKSPTITIYKTKDNYTFGGYTDKNWDIYSRDLICNNAFLFSFDHMKMHINPPKNP